jgi:Zn-dependent metalloprotease
MVQKNVSKRFSKILDRDRNLEFRYNEDSSVLKYLRGNLAKVSGRRLSGLRSTGLKFLRTNSDLFGKKFGDLRILQETEDPQGGKDLILQQYHGKYRVYSGSIKFHANKEGTLDSISNNLIDLTGVPLRAKISSKKAIDIAEGITNYKLQPEQAPELLVYNDKGKIHLSWEVRLYELENSKISGPSYWIIYVDAISGEPFLYYDNIQTAGAAVGNGTGYYSGSGSINCYYNDTTYQLRDTTRTTTGGPEIITNDEEGASPSEDSDSDWNDSTTSPRDQNQGPEVDAHRFAGNAVDYFKNVHGRNSFDNSGGNIEIIVHSGTNFNNAFWNPVDKKIRLGDGSGTAPGDDYECADDLLAHELTHGFTQHTCSLEYKDESGALNEAFSDIFAAFITGKNWLMMENVWLKGTISGSGPAWRNMMDPTNGGKWDGTNPQSSVLSGHQPNHYSTRYIGTYDNGGVHINSGIINNLFFLLTDGGIHSVSGILVTGIGQSAAEKMLFRCMTVDLVGIPKANFLNFRDAMLSSCSILFPLDTFKLFQVIEAFRAVGIGPDVNGLPNMVLYRPGTGTMWILKKDSAGVFSPVYSQGDPGNGIGGYDLASPDDRAFAFDFNVNGSTGRLDHIVLYRPGTGTIWILEKDNTSIFKPVYSQGDPGIGIGGYDLASPADRAFAFDYNSSGRMDHIALYRPGTGTIWIVRWIPPSGGNPGVFRPVYVQGDPGNGIGGYDLASPADRAFAFDYNSSGRMDHIALYRPGTGTMWILKKDSAGVFSPVYSQGDPGNGIGGYDLASPADRAFAFNFT